VENGGDGGGRARAIAARVTSYSLFSVGFATAAIGRLAARIPRQNSRIRVLNSAER
jgi:hypothetical protein